MITYTTGDIVLNIEFHQIVSGVSVKAQLDELTQRWRRHRIEGGLWGELAQSQRHHIRISSPHTPHSIMGHRQLELSLSVDMDELACMVPKLEQFHRRVWSGSPIWIYLSIYQS